MEQKKRKIKTAAVLAAGGIAAFLPGMILPAYSLHMAFAQEAAAEKTLAGVTVEYLEEDGENKPGSDGYFAIEKETDEKGRVIRRTFLDEENQPVAAVSKGYVTVFRKFDEKGNIVREDYSDADGNPVIAVCGYASVEKDYNEKKKVIAERYFDVDGSPLVVNVNSLGEPGRGYASITRERDENGYITHEAYYDAEGDPVIALCGYASVDREPYDEEHVDAEWYYDEEGNPLVVNVTSTGEAGRGYASFRRERDEDGYVTRESYFGADGEPIIALCGYASKEKDYDKSKRVIAERYFDTEGQPVRVEEGYVAFERSYDDEGRVAEAVFYGVEGDSPLFENYYGTREVYDNDGNVILKSWYDEEGNLLAMDNGACFARSEYDDQKKLIREDFFDSDGEPAVTADGYASIRYQYDPEGNMALVTAYDPQGSPVWNEKGYFTERKQFSDRKKVIRTDYLDDNGNPVMTTGGYALKTDAYDEKGHMIFEAYFDETGEPVQQEKGFYCLTKAYNDIGKVVRTTYLDENGKPVNTTDGYAVLVNEYDRDGDAFFEAYYDAEGNLFTRREGYAAQHRYYNDHHQVIRREYLDRQGNIVNTSDRYAFAAIEYDQKNRQVYMAWYDASGNRVTRASRNSFLTKEYLQDGDTQIVRTRYYDSSGKPVTITSGYAVLEVYNDKNGTKIGEAYFDQDLNPVCKAGQLYVRLTIEKREDGVTVTKYYNALGEIVKTEEEEMRKIRSAALSGTLLGFAAMLALPVSAQEVVITGEPVVLHVSTVSDTGGEGTEYSEPEEAEFERFTIFARTKDDRMLIHKDGDMQDLYVNMYELQSFMPDLDLNSYPEAEEVTAIAPGARGDEVKALQEVLKKLGCLEGNADGAYGSGTARAVRKFQEEHGLEATGTADICTMMLIAAVGNGKEECIEISAETYDSPLEKFKAIAGKTEVDFSAFMDPKWRFSYDPIEETGVIDPSIILGTFSVESPAIDKISGVLSVKVVINRDKNTKELVPIPAITVETQGAYRPYVQGVILAGEETLHTDNGRSNGGLDGIILKESGYVPLTKEIMELLGSGSVDKIRLQGKNTDYDVEREAYDTGAMAAFMEACETIME